MGNNYSSRICCSALNKRLINTICRERLVKGKPEFEGIKISENMILTSMIKNYVGLISLKQFEEDFNANKSKHK